MNAPEIRITVRGPDAVVHDITERALDGMGPLTQEIEEDLLEFVHDDLDLEIDDRDGWASEYFGAARSGDVYEVVVERETNRRRPKWERVFGGVIDAPASVSRDHRERTVSLQVFSFSKLLEAASAENVKRTIEGRTGSVTAGSSTVTVNDTSEILAGDEITLDDGTNRETQKVEKVNSATSLTTVANFADSFSGATLTLETSWYRTKSINELAETLFQRAGIVRHVIDVTQTLSAVPFPSPLNETGLPETAPKSVLESSGSLKVYTNAKRYGAEDLASGFADEGASSVKVDWRPYKTTEPGVLRDAASVDNGARAWDHDGGDYYDLIIDLNENLILRKNGVAIATVQTGGTGGGASNGYDVISVEWHEGLSQVWVGYSHLREIDGVPVNTNGGIKRYDSTGTLIGSTTTVAALRYSAKLGGMLAQEYGFTGAGDLIDDGPLAFYSGASRVAEYAHATGVEAWTLRAMAQHVLGVREQGGKSFVVIWDEATGSIVADHEVAPSTGGAYATVFDDGETSTPAYVCWAAGTWAVVSTAFSETVPYADFEGMSCGEALKQLAITSAAFLRVDEYQVGYLVARSTAPAAFGLYPRDIDGAPVLERTTRSVWDEYRSSVAVTGRDEAGEEFEVLVGPAGDSARRFEIDAQLVTFQGLASALGQRYLDWLNREVQEEEVTIEEPTDGPVRLLETVILDGRRHLAVAVETDFLERTQDLRLVAEHS